MKVLFENAEILHYGKGCLVTEGPVITYLGQTRPEGTFDRVIDCRHRLLMPGLYNCHSHAAMTLFRGYGEDMPLQSWLNDRIFPAEDLLTDKAVYIASLWAIAEMLRGGTVSFSDMYFFCDNTARAVEETGIKANISRSIVSFDPEIDLFQDTRFLEARRLFEEWNGRADRRITVEMALHAEYTNVPKACRQMAAYCRSVGARMHLHLSETEREHQECIARHGKTPARFFADAGVFDVPTTAAHCVWVTDEDMDLMREKGVYAIHNPASNLKLGSGIMPLSKMLSHGVSIAIGTDGASSNNTLDMFSEMYLASLLQKGSDRDPSAVKAETIISFGTEQGARAQGRADCGRLEIGYRADLVLLDLDAINNIPYYDPAYTVLYSAHATDVCLTMVDGRILYENGDFTTIDIEKLRYDMRYTCEHYFEKQK